MNDFRHAIRFLLKSPGFTAVALLTLALGIGANTAIFTLVNAVILRGLPVGHPSQLVLLTDPTAMGMSYGTSGGRRGLLAFPEYRRLRRSDHAFTGLLAAASMSARDPVQWGSGGAELVRAELVSANYFSVLQVPAYRGRTFNPSAPFVANGDPVAVMSYDYWRRRFAANPAVVGRTFTLYGRSFTVIGVTPPGFHGISVGDVPDLYFPMSMAPAVQPGPPLLTNPPGVSRVMWLQVMGRLKPGFTRAQAQAATNVIFRRTIRRQAAAAADPQSRHSILSQYLQLTPGARGVSGLRGQFGDPLWALFALVAMVLLLAIVNLASLLLARAAARHKEIGVRLALGAGPGRIVRQLLTESLTLAIAGGVAGALLAIWGARLLVRMVSGAGMPIQLSLTPDWRVWGFIAFLCIASGVLFGLVPALRLARLDVNDALQSQGRGGSARSRHILSHWHIPGWPRGGLPLGKLLIIGQVALAVVLLVGAGLFVRSLRQLTQVPLGFNPHGLYAFRLDTARAGYHGAAAGEFMHQLRQRIAALPGVAALAISDNGLFDGSECGLPVSALGYTAPNGKPGFGVRCDSVTAGYFRVTGIPIILGRALGPQDESGAKHIVINQTLAQRVFAHRVSGTRGQAAPGPASVSSPIGQQLHDLYPDDHNAVYTIVGVAADAKHNSLSEKPAPRIYLPFYNGLPVAVGQYSGGVYMIRAAGGAEGLAAGVHRVLHSLDPSLPPPTLQPMAALVQQSLAPQAMLAELSGFFAAVALLLAAIGLYGVTAYGLARRVPEIGVRMALGANRRAVVAMVLGETAVVVILGFLIGLPASLAGGKVLASQIHLFGLRFYDPVALAAAVLALAAAAFLAAWLPALRASRVDPLTALRQE